MPVSQTACAADPGSGHDLLAEEVLDLFDRFRSPLLRYLSSFRLVPPDGEEVLQEVFLSLLLHLRRGRSRENLHGWLFRVAHNQALKRCCQTRRDFAERVEEGSEYIALDPSPSPEDQVMNTQTQQRLRAVVSALPQQDRRCLFLRAEGLRYREIADIVGMSLGAVSLSLARSLGRIARAAER